MKRFLRLARRYWFDALIFVGLALGLFGAVVSQDESDGPTGPLWFDLLAVTAIVTPLFFRRRFPFGAPIAVGVAVGLTAFVDERLVPKDFIPFVAGCAAVFLVGLLRERAQAVAGIVLAIGFEALVAYRDPLKNLSAFIATCIVFGLIWTVAFALGRKFQEADEAKERAARAEREREERARSAVTEERARIARELHDVVGHSVSVMTVQASAVRRLLRPDQQREREALLVVERTGREALAEMRRMVGVLRRRPEEGPALAPQPSLEHVERLVAQAREAGLPVELRIEGDPLPLPAGVDLTAYRLVQEGLTNALKHAGAQRAQVLVRYGDGGIEVTVSDDGRGAGSGDGGGHGLVGMRERVAVYGGELEAGPREEGGYRLRAKLPVVPA
ncbi:MAG: histidine kinase [Actinomycetota bacterium]|nr:histidine kinase [Actinomycetota bacterium]